MESSNKCISENCKSSEQSVVINTDLILPSMSNLMGNLQGGQLMHFMDIAGALTCRKHSDREVATVKRR